MMRMGGRGWHYWEQPRWRRGFRGADAPPPFDASSRVATLLSGLELNARQKEEADEVFATIARALGPAYASWTGVDEALAAVASDPFDRHLAEASLPAPADVRRKLVEELEHLNVILTSEQHARLREKLGGPPTAA
jgi:hypothetical protein